LGHQRFESAQRNQVMLTGGPNVAWYRCTSSVWPRFSDQVTKAGQRKKGQTSEIISENFAQNLPNLKSNN